ncbi:transposase [Streptomyces alkaliphilus]|uniref:transposase n=1 Tax=Streptomyces alkaliphilus TaxID=1472722 RepID=UPI001E345BE9
MPYATGLSEEQWALIEPLATTWKQERATEDPGSCDLREVANTLLHQNRAGCQWRLLPHDLRYGRWCSTASLFAARTALTSGSRRSCAARCGSGPDDQKTRS